MRLKIEVNGRLFYDIDCQMLLAQMLMQEGQPLRADEKNGILKHAFDVGSRIVFTASTDKAGIVEQVIIPVDQDGDDS